MKKIRLTFEQHAKLGKELKRIRDYLVKAHVEIANALPHSARAVRMVRNAHKSVDSLRCTLDGHLFIEHKDKANPRIYYPKD